MGAVCTRHADARGGYGVCSCTRLADGICTRPNGSRGASSQDHARAISSPATSPLAAKGAIVGGGSAPRLVGRLVSGDTEQGACGPGGLQGARGGARDTRLAEVTEVNRREAPGLPVEVPFQSGDDVVVQRELGGGYQLQQGEMGKVIHIDGDGDALIAFPDQAEQWVHSSMFSKLQKVSQDVPFGSQVCRLLPAVCLSMCGWNILAGFAEAAYWHFLDPAAAGPPTLLVGVTLAAVLSFPVIDFCGLQVCITRFANLVAFLPPLFFGAAAVQGSPVMRSVLLGVAAAAQGWAVVASLGGVPSSRRRQIDGWGVLLAVIVMPMIRWTYGSVNPFLTNSTAQLLLGCAGAASAAANAADSDAGGGGEEGEPQEGEPQDCGVSCCQLSCEWSGWPAAISAGLMGGSAIALFRAYLSSLQQPALSAYADPSYLLALASLGALAFGVFALAAVWCMTPWWLDTCQAALVIGVLPLVACCLQGTAGESIHVWGPVRGSGFSAYCGLLLLAAVFPFMVALFSKELCLLAQSRALGRALFVVGAYSVASFMAYLAVLFGDRAPAGGSLLQGELWLYALGLGVSWCVGVWAAPNGASRPSVHDLWYLSRHSGPPKRDYMNGALCLIVLVFALFLGAALPMRMAGASVQGPADKDLLIVAGYNVQQGFDLRGAPNVDCVSTLLADANADLVGLSESSAAHAATASSDPALAYAGRLKMQHYSGIPGSLPTAGQALLSRLPMHDASASALQAPAAAAAGSSGGAGTHLWTRSTVGWQGIPVQFHVVRTESSGATADEQIRYVAHELRTKFQHGPMVLVGSFGLPVSGSTRPAHTALVELVNGTGLREVFSALKFDAPLPLPPTEFTTGLHHDYIFYRGLEPVGKWIHSRVQCSDHMLVVASFRVGQR